MCRLAMTAGLLALDAAPALARDKVTIEKLNDAWTVAFNKGDAAAVAAMYTEDAFVPPPSAEMVGGRAAIEAFWRQKAQQLGDAKLTTLDLLLPTFGIQQVIQPSLPKIIHSGLVGVRAAVPACSGLPSVSASSRSSASPMPS